MSDIQIDRQHGRVRLLAGAVLLGYVVWLLTRWNYGILTVGSGMFVVAAFGTLQQYRTDRVLWTIGVLITVFGAAMWGMFVAADWVPLLRGTTPPPVTLSIQTALCTFFWGYGTRLAVSMTLHNYRNVHPRWPRLFPKSWEW